jgi:hypothetical protein
VNHAAWPEEKHESASKEIICWPLTAAAIERAAPRAAELIVNLKTAKSLGLAISETFLVRADKVIE